MYFYMALMFVVMNVVSLVGGFPAWVVCCGFAFLFNLIVWVTYYVLMCIRRGTRMHALAPSSRRPLDEVPVVIRVEEPEEKPEVWHPVPSLSQSFQRTKSFLAASLPAGGAYGYGYYSDYYSESGASDKYGDDGQGPRPPRLMRARGTSQLEHGQQSSISESSLESSSKRLSEKSSRLHLRRTSSSSSSSSSPSSSSSSSSSLSCDDDGGGRRASQANRPRPRNAMVQQYDDSYGSSGASPPSPRPSARKGSQSGQGGGGGHGSGGGHGGGMQALSARRKSRSQAKYDPSAGAAAAEAAARQAVNPSTTRMQDLAEGKAKTQTLTAEESKWFREQALGKDVVKPEPKLSVVPKPFGSTQRRLANVSAMVIWGLGFITCAAFFGMPMSFYQVYDPVKDHGLAEVNPNVVISKGNMVMYAYEGVASTLRMNAANRWLTDACGKRFNRILTEKEKRVEILTNFISLYDIDMSVYERENYLDYRTVNDWFSRTIKKELRPVANSTTAVVSPADARYVVYNDVESEVKIWLKGESFNPSQLVSGSKKSKDGERWDGGSLMIARLAPQDYHRFHSPVAGVIKSINTVPGKLHSVNADGIRSANGAIYNVRKVIILEVTAGARTSQVAFVAIGAVCVGSVTITKTLGDVILQGDELGYFEFGGSTVAVLFEKGAVEFSKNITEVSKVPVETILNMGVTVGDLATS
jgi:phosphatidylserine decarboxylase precursor